MTDSLTDWKSPRGRVAALTRSRAADDPDLINARREMRAARLAEYILKVVDGAPALTDDQRTKLAALLTPVTSTTTSATAASGRAA